MGYIPSTSGFTCVGDLSVVWTDLGRKYILERQDKDKSLVYYFSLSDRDKNYINALEPANSFIPDLTGNVNACLPATLSNIVLNPIQVEGNGNSNIIDYRTKSLKGCVGEPLTFDCSKYYDMYPINPSDPRASERLGDSIWECFISEFSGTLT